MCSKSTEGILTIDPLWLQVSSLCLQVCARWISQTDGSAVGEFLFQETESWGSLFPPLCRMLAAPKLWQIPSQAQSFTDLFGADRIKFGWRGAGERGEMAEWVNRKLLESKTRDGWSQVKDQERIRDFTDAKQVADVDKLYKTTTV